MLGVRETSVVNASVNPLPDLPDALSKTIPIWTSVLNRLLFPSPAHSWSHTLHTLPSLISPSERAQILERIPSCVAAARNLGLDLDSLRTQLQHKPLRPVWIARSLGSTVEVAQRMLRDNGDEDRCVPIYLCMASLHHESRMAVERDEGYVQGAGDDGEHWSRGLTPGLFWQHRKRFMEMGEQELMEFVGDVVAKGAEERGKGGCTRVERAPWLQVGALNDADVVRGKETIMIFLGQEEELTAVRTRCKEVEKRLHCFVCAAGKLGSKDLRKHFPQVMSCIRSAVVEGRTLCVCDPSGKDLAVGVTLAALCLHTTDAGNVIRGPSPRREIDKAMIRQRLTWITSSMHAANPSRATLNAVNEFLMSERHVP